jgi:predicted nucleic acid-binding protein
MARGRGRSRSEEVATLTVLDASALVAVLAGEPAAEAVERILRGHNAPAIAAVNLAEAIDILVRVIGREPDAVRDRIDWLIAGGLVVEPVWLPVARLAAALRAQHYHRTDMPLSLADCVCLATAMHRGANLATTDPALARIARATDIEVIALPDSQGRRP